MANLGQFGKIYLVLLTLTLRFNNMKINFFQVSIQAMIIKSHLQPCLLFLLFPRGGSKEWCSWNR